jgi:glutathione S-transferase
MAYYIEQAFPEPALIPSSPRQRGLVHALEDWADESLYFYEMVLRFTTPGNSERNTPKLIENEAPVLRWLLKRMIPRLLRKATSTQGIGRKSPEQLATDTRRHIEAVANMLGQEDWLVANRLTLADLAVYAMFQCFRDADFVATMLGEYPPVTDWMTRIEDSTSTRAS